MKRLRLLIASTMFLMAGSAICDQTTATSPHIPLPTPRTHYETFKPGTSGLPLLLELTKELDPEEQKAILNIVAASGLLGGGIPSDFNSPELTTLLNIAQAAGITKETVIPREKVVELLEQSSWVKYRPLLLEFSLHQSQVLEISRTYRVERKYGSRCCDQQIQNFIGKRFGRDQEKIGAIEVVTNS